MIFQCIFYECNSKEGNGYECVDYTVVYVLLRKLNIKIIKKGQNK